MPFSSNWQQCNLFFSVFFFFFLIDDFIPITKQIMTKFLLPCFLQSWVQFNPIPSDPPARKALEHYLSINLQFTVKRNHMYASIRVLHPLQAILQYSIVQGHSIRRHCWKNSPIPIHPSNLLFLSSDWLYHIISKVDPFLPFLSPYLLCNQNNKNEMRDMWMYRLERELNGRRPTYEKRCRSAD